MKTLAAFAAIAFAGTLEGQAVRDPVTKNPVEISTRLQMTIRIEQRSVKVGESVLLHV